MNFHCFLLAQEVLGDAFLLGIAASFGTLFTKFSFANLGEDLSILRIAEDQGLGHT